MEQKSAVVWHKQCIWRPKIWLQVWPKRLWNPQCGFHFLLTHILHSWSCLRIKSSGPNASWLSWPAWLLISKVIMISNIKLISKVIIIMMMVTRRIPERKRAPRCKKGAKACYYFVQTNKKERWWDGWNKVVAAVWTPPYQNTALAVAFKNASGMMYWACWRWW